MEPFIMNLHFMIVPLPVELQLFHCQCVYCNVCLVFGGASLRTYVVRFYFVSEKTRPYVPVVHSPTHGLLIILSSTCTKVIYM